MKGVKIVFLFGILGLSLLLSCSKKTVELTWNAEVDTIEDSRYLLKNQMSDSLYQSIEERKVKKKDRLIKTEMDAIVAAKPVLLKEMGDGYHMEQRRFLAHLVNGYWVIKGLQPIGFTGGTLVAIIDSKSGELYRTLNWK